MLGFTTGCRDASPQRICQWSCILVWRVQTKKCFGLSKSGICDNFCSNHLSPISCCQTHETILKKIRECCSHLVKCFVLPRRAGYHSPSLGSHLGCLYTVYVSQQRAAQLFLLSSYCMLVLWSSEVLLNQSTSGMKLHCLFCFDIWQKWASGGNAEHAVVSLEHDTTVQGNSRDPCNHFSVLTFVSQQVVPAWWLH